MGKIIQLDNHLANMIAAGEVVENHIVLLKSWLKIVLMQMQKI